MNRLNSTEPEQEIFLRMPAVARQTGLGKSTLYGLISQGQFPSPLRISDRCVAWRQSEVQAWMRARIEGAKVNHAANA